ncbi:MAG TPA: DUF4105 domain-containing protein [Longimicrobium sp.]|nr:DUF4105 domain-containing protein [Longimicrobium sp.]
MLTILLVAGLFAWAATRPSHGRVWRAEQAVLPQVTFDGSKVHVRNVRDFTYRSKTDFTPGYRDRTYDLDRIETLWFGLSPFTREWRGPAHAFLSFGFSDSQYVAVSVEARREATETYSVWKGALRRYELIYVIGEERDVIGVRAVTWNVPVHLYPIRATREQVRALFVGMMERARQVEQRPEFYHTFTNNCTTNILDPVNRIATRRIPFGLEVILPGYADRLAHERGLIDTDLPLARAREHFLVNDRARAAIAYPDFSIRIRA